MSDRPDILACGLHRIEARGSHVEAGLVFRVLEILHRLRIVDFKDIHFYEWNGYVLDMENN